MDFEAVTLGNAIIDAFLTIHDANACCRFNKRDNELCIESGEKILLDSCSFLLGGGACNVGVGLARLGQKTGIIAEIGTDEFAQKVKNTLLAEHVSLELLKTEDRPTSFSMILNFQKDRTIFTNQVTSAHNFSFDTFQARLFYLAALGREWKEVYKNVALHKKNHDILLAFNPGPLQLEEGRDEVLEVAAVADFLFVNKEEAAKIFNFQFSRLDSAKRAIFNENEEKVQMKKLLYTAQEHGSKAVVITDGNNGSYAVDETGKIYFLGIFPAEVVEKTGAGDAYSSGFLSAILFGESVLEGMRWGAVNSASVIGHIGAQKGLLSSEEIQKRLHANSEFQVKQL